MFESSYFQTQTIVFISHTAFIESSCNIKGMQFYVLLLCDICRCAASIKKKSHCSVARCIAIFLGTHTSNASEELNSLDSGSREKRNGLSSGFEEHKPLEAMFPEASKESMRVRFWF